MTTENKTMTYTLEPLEVAGRVAQRVITRNDFYANYKNDMNFESLLYLFDVTGHSTYLTHVLKVWQQRKWVYFKQCRRKEGWQGVLRYLLSKQKATYLLNWRTPLFTCLHFETFLRTGDDQFIASFIQVAKDFRRSVPRDKQGAIISYSKPKINRIFVDMLQGYTIFMARAGWLSGDTTFFDECVDQYSRFHAILCDPQTGLWHQGRGFEHALDHVSPDTWGRGQGWVMRGLVESLCYLPPTYSKRQALLDMLVTLAAALKTHQDKRGMWHQLVDEPKAYPETSGSAFLIHYLYRAIKAGWLPESVYLPVAEKGLQALLGFVHEDGTVSNACQGTPPLPHRSDYRYRPAVIGDPHSEGPLIMACTAPYLSANPPHGYKHLAT